MKILLQTILILICSFFFISWSFAKFKGKISEQTLNQSSIEEIDSENFPDKIKSFDYPDAQIVDVVKAMSQLTGLNFIIDPAVNKKISIIAPSEITVAEAFQAFLSALAINGYTLVRSGAFWKVITSKKASQDNIQIYKGEYFPDADQYITKIIKVKYASVSNLEKEIKQFLSEDHKSMFYKEANTIILSDYGSTIEKITQIIKELDVPNVNNHVEVIPINYAPAADLTNKINMLIYSRNAPSFSMKSSRPGSNLIKSRKDASTTGISALIPDERTNSIIISGTKKGIEKIRKLIQKLDSEFNAQNSGGIFVYYVKYGVAEEIAKTLNEILQPKSKKSLSKSDLRYSSLRSLIGASSVHDNIQITHDSNTNSLLVTAKKHSFQALQTILDKIDIPKHQVFIKTIIMDLNAENNLNWDMTTYKFLGDENKGISGLLPRIGFSSRSLRSLIEAPGRESVFSFATGLLNLSSPAPWMASMAAGSVLKGDTNSNNSLQIPSLLSLVNILKSTTGGNILSTPQLIAVDNEESSISVGVNAPVGTTETLGDLGRSSTRSQERQDINTELKITPRINPDGNSVRLSIEQKIDSINPTTAGSDKLKEAVTITKRKIVTNIILKNQETAVLGGLMHDEEIEENHRVPLLGDIPIMGWLFRGQGLKKVKKNLIVFITPQIIKSSEDTKSIVKDHIDKRIELMKKFMNFPERNEQEMYKALGQSAPNYSSYKAVGPSKKTQTQEDLSSPYFPVLSSDDEDNFLIHDDLPAESVLNEPSSQE